MSAPEPYPVYRTVFKCVKCGFGLSQFTTEFFADNVGTKEKSRPYMRRVCKNCKYSWRELPLDEVNKES